MMPPVPPVLETLAELIRINSINPEYDQGRPEGEIGLYIEQFFRDRGIGTWRQDVLPGRPNVVAKLAGRNPHRRVILEAHVDTASITGMTIPPFEPEVRDGLMFGRGSCDNKGGLAAMMHAFAAIHESGEAPPCEVWLVAAADEEYSFRGVTKLCELLDSASAAIVAEPTELRAVVASKGIIRFKIRTHGKAAHSSKPHLGVNAISQMVPILAELDRNASDLGSLVHPLLGVATQNVGVIRGGVQVNFVPDECEIEIDRRLLPGESSKGALAAYEALLSRVRANVAGLDASIDPPMLVDEPLETPPNSAVAQTAGRVLRLMGLPDELGGVPYGSDASKLSRKGVPSIIFGPGSIDRAHAAVEYVECDQVIQAEEFYRRFLLGFE
ncbi:MAG: M20 family metallopeptidase [Acidobacteriota bacterium]